MYYVYEVFFVQVLTSFRSKYSTQSEKSGPTKARQYSLHINQPHYKCPVLHDSMFPRSNPPLIRVLAVVPYIAGKSGAKIELR